MNHPNPTPEQEFVTAQHLYQQGDLPHATFHLAYALMSDPMNEQWRGLLDTLIKQSGDNANQLIQPDDTGNIHFSHGAVMAYIHASHGDYDSALRLISQVHGAVRHNVYLVWVVEWLTSHPNVETTEIETITMYVMRDMQNYTSGRPIPPEQQAQYNQILPALEAIRKKNSTHGHYHSILSSLLRRIDQIDTALTYAKQGYQLKPEYLTALMVALVYRDSQDYENALSWYKTSVTHNPMDVPVHLDIADMFIQMNQRADAIDYYRRAMRLDPNNSWATPHYYYYSYFEDKDTQHLDDLKTYAEQHPDIELAQNLYQRLMHYINAKAYVNYIPTPAEAGLSALRQIDEQKGKGALKSKDFNMAISALESPSMRTVFEQYFIEDGGEDKPNINVTVSEIQQPDPRQPMKNVPYLLWKYEGTTAIKNLPVPPPKIAEAVGKIAYEQFDIDTWRGLARQLSGTLNEKHIPQLLATMLHPPTSQSPYRVWDWLYRVQLASALVIAYIGTDWKGSERRKALLSLAFGPMDWTTDAGLFALAQLAEADPEIAQEVVNVYRTVYSNMPKNGHLSYISVLTELGLNLPSLPDTFRQQLEQLKQDWFD